MACLELQPSRQWREAYLRESQRQLPRFGTQALSNVIWAVAQLGWAPPAPWLAMFQDQCDMKSSFMTPQDRQWIGNALASLDGAHAADQPHDSD